MGLTTPTAKKIPYLGLKFQLQVQVEFEVKLKFELKFNLKLKLSFKVKKEGNLTMFAKKMKIWRCSGK